MRGAQKQKGKRKFVMCRKCLQTDMTKGHACAGRRMSKRYKDAGYQTVTEESRQKNRLAEFHADI